jgi:DNA-binding transcriptional LysR family regulator
VSGALGDPAYTLDQVRGFVAVAEERHFGRAAERLRMTQPPLSRQIQRLEREIGVRLLYRSQRAVELTAAGEAFLAEARRLLAVAEAAPETARRVGDGEVGTVRIGFTAASGFGFLGDLLNRIQDRLPGIELVLGEMVSAEQLAALDSGMLDLALVRPPADDPEYASRLVQREELLLALPRDHPLAETDEPAQVHELQGQPLLQYAPEQARYFAELTARILAPITHRTTHSLSQVHTMAALVAAGQGIALLPASVLRLRPAGVRFRTLAGVEPRPVALHAVWRRDTANPALCRVTALLDDLPGATGMPQPLDPSTHREDT